MSFLQGYSLLSKFISGSGNKVRPSSLRPVILFERLLKVKVKKPQPKLSQIKWKFDDNMDYGIYAASSGYIKDAALEAARVSIKRKASAREVWMTEADTPVTKKSIGSRMGKGKGKLHHYVRIVKAGEKMFEFNCSNEYLARAAFRAANFKLPVRSKLRIHPKLQRSNPLLS